MTEGFVEVKKQIESSFEQLKQEKVGNPQHAALEEKVAKLELSMRDNRQILSESGGQEINAVVKRIILNMEDKIMVLEKKIDALADTKHRQESPSPQHSEAVLRRPYTAGEEAVAMSLGEDLSAISQAVSQLRQDIVVSKVHIEEIQDQGQQNLELASRLNVLVESAGLQGMEDEGTILSLNRVQVMIAAAARQLVAGSKWITKETFDARLGEMRSEYLVEARQIHVKLDDVTSRMAKVVSTTALVSVPTKLPKMIVNRFTDESADSADFEARTAREHMPPASAPGVARPLAGLAAPLSARGQSRPSTESRPRMRIAR